jgi:hypothetical protein
MAHGITKKCVNKRPIKTEKAVTMTLLQNLKLL